VIAASFRGDAWLQHLTAMVADDVAGIAT